MMTDVVKERLQPVHGLPNHTFGTSTGLKAAFVGVPSWRSVTHALITVLAAVFPDFVRYNRDQEALIADLLFALRICRDRLGP